MKFHPNCLSLLSRFSVFFSLLILFAGPTQALNSNNSLGDLPANQTFNGIDSRDTGTVATYTIPTGNWPSSLVLWNVRGGDGGRAKATATVGESQTGNGGGGAWAQASFTIDLTATDALRPGGEIRFVVGNKGQDKTRGNAAGSGGGGGTAVLYRAPTPGASWELLVVAGGGGGGAASTVFNDTFQQNGADASRTINGTNGKGDNNVTGRSGGNNGDAGVTVQDGHGGGGGSHRQHSTSSNGTHWISSGNSGGSQGSPGGESSGLGSWGGFGFGSGGGGYVNTNGSTAHIGRGGGGGGYSGGGAGGNDVVGDGAGGGGGSYVNSKAVFGLVFNRNSQRLNGVITYSTSGGSSGSSIPGPSIAVIGGNPFVLEYGSSYADKGASGVDYYGNSVTVTASGNSNVTNGVPGTHQVVYSATDQFGKTTTATRTVIVENPNPPVFSIAGYVSRNENSGAYSQANFATNFNAIDPGETLDSYTVTNDNNALFSAQPSINNQGVLTFTPSSNAFGSASVTVIATDTNPYPQYADSSPLTFTITVNEVSLPPTFSLAGNITRNGDAPPQVISSFATNFGANDVGQSFDRYELTNDNMGLFSGQPAINSAGALTFTPDGETFGSATVTVTGYDDGPFNNSSSRTFTITLTVPDPIVAFRDEYGLASDGSDDAADWSNNGVANILYHVFGLGDPSEANIDRSHLPKQTNDGNTLTVRYRHRFPVVGFSIAHLTSTDLSNWESSFALIGTAEAPIDITSSIDEPGYLTTSITYPASGTSRFFNFAITASGVTGE